MIDRPDINDSKEWSEMDIWDLKNHLHQFQQAPGLSVSCC